MTDIELREYHSDFLDHLEENYRHNTYRNYKYAVSEFVQYFQERGETLVLEPDQVYESADTIKEFYKETNLHPVKTNAVRNFLDYIGKQLSSRHQNMINDVAEMVKYSNVADDGGSSTHLTVEDVEPMILDEDEFQSALYQAQFFETLVLKALMDTGCRASELAATQESDYDFDPGEEGRGAKLEVTKTYVSGRIQDIPKTGDGRRAVELGESAADLLEDFIDLEEVGGGERVFGNYSRIYNAVKDAFRRAGVRTFVEDGERKTRVSPHWLRHNAATRLVKRGDLSDREVKEYMGWSSVDMIEVYTHFDESDVIGVHAS